jgi:hypothetical protein
MQARRRTVETDVTHDGTGSEEAVEAVEVRTLMEIAAFDRGTKKR